MQTAKIVKFAFNLSAPPAIISGSFVAAVMVWLATLASIESTFEVMATFFFSTFLGAFVASYLSRIFYVENKQRFIKIKTHWRDILTIINFIMNMIRWVLPFFSISSPKKVLVV